MARPDAGEGLRRKFVRGQTPPLRPLRSSSSLLSTRGKGVSLVATPRTPRKIDDHFFRGRNEDNVLEIVLRESKER